MVGDVTPNVAFFSKMTRDDVPSGIAKVYDTMAAVQNFSSSWMHGFASQATQFAVGVGLAATAPINPVLGATGAWMAGRAAMKAGMKYVGNTLGNKRGYAFRGYTLLSTEKLDETMSRMFNKDIETKLGSAVAASASRRLNQGVTLDPQITANNRIALDEYDGWTLPAVRQYNELQKVKDHFDGIGKVMSDEDIASLQEHIRKAVFLKDRVVADIRNGQVSLSLYNDQGQFIRSLSDLQQANFNDLNRVFVGTAKLGKASMLLSPENRIASWLNPGVTLARINNARLQVWTKQGATEEMGVLRTAAMGEQSFDKANVNKIISKDDVARVNFANAVVDLAQGKFDQRALHLRTPLGKAMTLFSQYSQNYNRRTLFGAYQEQQLFKGMIDAYAEDLEFRKALVSTYGIDVGNQVVQTPYLRTNPETGQVESNLMGFVPMTKSGLALAATGVISAGLTYLFNNLFASNFGGYVDEDVKTEIARTNRQFWGDNPLGNIVKGGTLTLLNGIQYAADLESDKNLARSNQEIWNDLVRSMPGGVGYAPAKEALGLTGLYMMYQSGMLPQYKAPDPWRVAQSASGSLGIVANIPTSVYGAYKIAEKDIVKQKKSSRRRRRNLSPE
jgi:hypothetical protein